MNGDGVGVLGIEFTASMMDGESGVLGLREMASGCVCILMFG